MRKIIFRNPKKRLDLKKLKGENTLVILPSQAAINFYIRDMLKNSVDITKTEFETFDGIKGKAKRKKPDTILKYIVLSKILKERFQEKEIFPETIDIVLDFFDDIVEKNLGSEDILKIEGDLFEKLSEVFLQYKRFFEKRSYELYDYVDKEFLEKSKFDSIIISGFLEFRKSEMDLIEELSNSNRNIYVDFPFNFIKSDLIKDTIDSLKNVGFEVCEDNFLNYREYLKDKKIEAISTKDDFYNLFFSQLKLTLLEEKVSDVKILTGSKKLADGIKNRESFEKLEFNFKKKENSLLCREFINLMDYFVLKDKTNTIKRVKLNYFKLPVNENKLESVLISFNFKNLDEINFDNIKNLSIEDENLVDFLYGVDFLKSEKIEKKNSIDYYTEFFSKYLKDAEEVINSQLEESLNFILFRELRFIKKLRESFDKVKRLEEFYRQITLEEFVLIIKKYIENFKTEEVQNLEGIEISDYRSNYFGYFSNLFLIGFDHNFENNMKSNFIYKLETEGYMTKIGLIKDNFQRDYIYLIYDLILADKIFILNEDEEKGFSKLLNTLIFDLNLDIEKRELTYKTLKLKEELENLKHDYNLGAEYISRINDKICSRVYSATDFDILKDCPRKFLFERVYKIEEFSRKYDEKFYLNMGDKYHHILEKYFKREKDFREKTLKEIILEEENLGDFESLNFLQKISVINTFNILKRYIEKDLIEQRKYGFVPKYFEESFVTEVSGIKIKGRIDRIYARSDEEILIDYKRSSVKNKKEIEDLKSFQMPIYAISRVKKGKKIANANYGSVKRAEIVTVIKNSDILPKDDNKKYYFTEEELQDLLKRVEDEIISMVSNIKSGNYNSDSKCKNCNYKEICENKEN